MELSFHKNESNVGNELSNPSSSRMDPIWIPPLELPFTTEHAMIVLTLLPKTIPLGLRPLVVNLVGSNYHCCPFVIL